MSRSINRAVVAIAAMTLCLTACSASNDSAKPSKASSSSASSQQTQTPSQPEPSPYSTTVGTVDGIPNPCSLLPDLQLDRILDTNVEIATVRPLFDQANIRHCFYSANKEYDVAISVQQPDSERHFDELKSSCTVTDDVQAEETGLGSCTVIEFTPSTMGLNGVTSHETGITRSYWTLSRSQENVTSVRLTVETNNGLIIVLLLDGGTKQQLTDLGRVMASSYGTQYS